MPHRPNQRLPALTPLPAQAQGLAVGRPGPAIVNGNEALLRDILEEIRNLRTGQEGFSPRADLRGVQDQFVGKIDISTALTKERVPTLLGQVLTILEFPQCLTTFEIRIGNRDAAPINVLTAGNQIRSGNAFRDIFVTTAPGFPAGVISFMSGPAGTELVTTDRFGIVDQKGIALRRIDFSNTGGNTNDAPDLDVINIDGPCSISKPHKQNADGNKKAVRNIPANRCCRAFGCISFLKKSGTTESETTWSKTTAGDTTEDSYFYRGIVTADGGSQIHCFDSGFVKFTEKWDLMHRITQGNAVGQDIESLTTLELY